MQIVKTTCAFAHEDAFAPEVRHIYINIFHFVPLDVEMYGFGFVVCSNYI